MSYKLSVIVPIYNPGKYVEPCIESLRQQTLPTADFEILFIDDGSTDATPARLDRLADELPNVRVVHQENSGWPGKPRNVGIEAARGTYVQFLDQDDTLGPEALSRMYAIGARNDADIVLGKVTSNFRGVPHRVFRHTVESCTIFDAPLIDSLTPHKMFRRAFLDEYGIRYPEGKRRLEDQLFMAQAYLAAKAVSIVGDYPCYFYRKRSDGKNAGSSRIEPAGYYANLREVLDAVVAGTTPGDFRDALLRRFYRGEMLGRLSEPGMLTYADDYRQLLFAEVRRLEAERFPLEVPAGLAAVPRLRSQLLRSDRCADLVELARICKQVKARAVLERAEWVTGRLRIELRAELVHADGSPVVLQRQHGRLQLDPRFVEPFDKTPFAADDEPAAASVDVTIRHRDTGVEWYVPSHLTASLRPSGIGDGASRLVFHGSAEADPLTLAGGDRLPPGPWDVSVRVYAIGLVRGSRVGAERLPGVEAGCLPAVLGSPAAVVVPYFTHPYGNLSLDVAEHGKSLGAEIARRGVVSGQVSDGGLALVLPVVTGPGTEALAARVALGGDELSSCTLPATIEASDGAAVLTARVAPDVPGPVARLRDGEWQLSIASADSAAAPVGTLRVATGAASAVRTARPRRPPATELKRLAASTVRDPRVVRLGRRTLGVLPAGASTRLEQLARRLAQPTSEDG